MNSFVGAFHDAVILYALALNETLEAGLNATNGTEVTRRMWNRTFEGPCTLHGLNVAATVEVFLFCRNNGLTENDGHENDEPSKLQDKNSVNRDYNTLQ